MIEVLYKVKNQTFYDYEQALEYCSDLIEVEEYLRDNLVIIRLGYEKVIFRLNGKKYILCEDDLSDDHQLLLSVCRDCKWGLNKNDMIDALLNQYNIVKYFKKVLTSK